MVLLKINSRDDGDLYYDISTIFNCETDGTTTEISFFPGYNVDNAANSIRIDGDKNTVTEAKIIALNEAIINASSRPGSTVDFNEVTGLECERQSINAGDTIPPIT